MRYSLLLAFAMLLTFSACKDSGEPTTDQETNTQTSTEEVVEDVPLSVMGTVYDLNIIEEPTGLWIFMEDKDGKEFELNYYRTSNPEKYDAMPEDLIEVEIQAFYDIEKDDEGKEIYIMTDYEFIPENPEN